MVSNVMLFYDYVHSKKIGGQWACWWRVRLGVESAFKCGFQIQSGDDVFKVHELGSGDLATTY